MKVYRFVIIAASLLGLSACNTAPEQHRFTQDGRACRQVGYSFNPYFIDPRTGWVC